MWCHWINGEPWWPWPVALPNRPKNGSHRTAVDWVLQPTISSDTVCLCTPFLQRLTSAGSPPAPSMWLRQWELTTNCRKNCVPWLVRRQHLLTTSLTEIGTSSFAPLWRIFAHTQLPPNYIGEADSSWQYCWPKYMPQSTLFAWKYYRSDRLDHCAATQTSPLTAWKYFYHYPTLWNTASDIFHPLATPG